MVLILNPGGSSSKLPFGDNFAVFSSEEEVAIFGSHSQSNACIRLCDTTSAYGNTIQTSSEALSFTAGSNNTTMVTMTATNNVVSVGINKTSPNGNYSLDINGNLNISNGNLFINGHGNINNLYTETIDGKDVSVIYSSFYVGCNASANSYSLHVPNGDGYFSGNGFFGNNGIFGGSLTAQQLAVNTLSMRSTDISYDGGITDTSYLYQTNSFVSNVNVNSFVNHVYSYNNTIYSTSYNKSVNTLNVCIQTCNISSLNFFVNNVISPVFCVGLNGIVIAGQTAILGIGQMTYSSPDNSIHSSGTPLYENDGFVMLFSSTGTISWINQVSKGIPTDAIFTTDGNNVLISGTYSATNVGANFFISTSGSAGTSGIIGSGAFVATLSTYDGSQSTSCTTFTGPILSPTISVDAQNNIIWGGTFSNIITCPSYNIQTCNIITCNISFTTTENIINDPTYGNPINSNLSITITSNMNIYNTYTLTNISTYTGSYNYIMSLYGLNYVPTFPPSVIANYISYTTLQAPSLSLYDSYQGYSNIFIVKQDNQRNLQWVHNLGGNNLSIKKILTNTNLNVSYTLLTIDDIKLYQPSSYSFIGLSNITAQNSEPTISTITINSSYSTTTLLNAYSSLNGNHSWIQIVPNNISSIVTTPYDNSLLLSSGQTFYKYDGTIGQQVLMYNPYSTQTPSKFASILSITEDPVYGNFILHGISLYHANLYFMDTTFLATCSPGTYVVVIPSYLLPTASTQITQYNATNPSLQVVQTGLGPVQRIISTNVISNLLEGYSKNNLMFSINPYGLMTMNNIYNSGNINTTNIIASANLITSNFAFINAITSSNVNIFQNLSTTNVYTSNIYSRQFTLDSTVGSNGNIYSWATTQMYQPLTVYNNVNFGILNAQTMQITSTNVNINSNLNVSQNIGTSNLATSMATIVNASIQNINISNTLNLGNQLYVYANGNTYNSSVAPFVGINTSAPFPSNSLLYVNGPASCYSLTCLNGLTVGSTNTPFFQVSSLSRTIVIGLNIANPTFYYNPNPIYVFNYSSNLLTNANITPNTLSLYVGNSTIIQDLYISSSITTASLNSGATVGICTYQNPNYALDISGSCRSTYFSGIGSNITQINATNITSGTINVAYLPSVIAQISSGIGQFKSIALIGPTASSDIQNVLIVDGNAKIINSSNISTGLTVGAKWNNSTSNNAIIGKLDSNGQWTNGTYMQIYDSVTSNVNNGSSILFNTYNYSCNISQERLRISANGYVGIGKSIPTKLLDISGDVIANNIYSNSNIYSGNVIANNVTCSNMFGNATSANKVNNTLTVGSNLYITSPYNGSSNAIITTNATTSATANTLVARDALGNITANAFNGTATKVSNSLSVSTYLSITNSFDGSSSATISTNATNTNGSGHGLTLVARDSAGNYNATSADSATYAASAGSAGYVTNSLTSGTFISMYDAQNNSCSFNGGTACTIKVTTSTTGAANSIVETDSNGYIHAPDIIATSDERLKTNIYIIPDALAKINKIDGVYYTFKSTNITSVGVTAQNVQKVLPEVVHTGEDGYLGVSYGHIVGLLVEGIKEISTKFDQYKRDTDQRIQTLENILNNK